MSTLKTTQIAHPSSVSNNIVLNSDGSATIADLTATNLTATNLTATNLTATDLTATTIQGTIKSGTAVASTSGTSIDFTNIPSWVKRITVMLNRVSLSGSSSYLIQLGDSGGIETTGYVSSGGYIVAGGTSTVYTSTAGFVITAGASSTVVSAVATINLFGSNTWCSAHGGNTGGPQALAGGGDKTLSDTLTQLRITTVNGTDTFDAGTINILYEG